MEHSGELQILTIENHGMIIKLDDGSEWEIHFLDSVKSGLWTPGTTKVSIREDLGDAFPYKDLLERREPFPQWVRAKKIS